MSGNEDAAVRLIEGSKTEKKRMDVRDTGPSAQPDDSTEMSVLLFFSNLEIFWQTIGSRIHQSPFCVLSGYGYVCCGSGSEAERWGLSGT